jgi:LytS/YehU family sensor histidine kinase
VKHGVSNRVGTGRLWIESRTEGDRLVLQVRDNGPGPQLSAAGEFITPEGSGVGLRNVQARLAELYGDDQGFALRAGEDGGAVAEISLPLHTREELRSGEAPAEPEGALHGA